MESLRVYIVVVERDGEVSAVEPFTDYAQALERTEEFQSQDVDQFVELYSRNLWAEKG